jgi:type II secretory ATPase GspE/PulE/Tfp pilus assembly ATPase PilB-like protein
MQELRTDGIRKAARGITSLEEVLRATQADVG